VKKLQLEVEDLQSSLTRDESKNGGANAFEIEDEIHQKELQVARAEIELKESQNRIYKVRFAQEKEVLQAAVAQADRRANEAFTRGERKGRSSS